jgi:signal transduction histidine kinase
MKNKQNKKKINTHFWSMAALSFVLILLVGELVVYIFQVINNKLINNVYVIMLYVLPAFSAVLTSILIYINHRTFQISNKLIDGLNKIADGNYNVTIPYKKLDSFNGVYANFNKMAEELKSVKTLREDFVRDFSHEFKTPIASINGFANLLLDGELTDDERAEILRLIADESARLSRLSESMLLLSRVENQQFIYEKKAFRLDLQLKECVIMLEAQWSKKNITINSELTPVTYNGDARLLQQVWINLLNNAIKFTPDGGTIGVSVAENGDNAQVKISDNGVGISEEALPKIFEKYFQGSNKKDGNGLGLAICTRIVDLSGGTIEAVSKVNEGTTFIVTL